MTEQNSSIMDDEDGLPAGYADWYNRRFKGMPTDTARDHACEESWRTGAAPLLARIAELEERAPVQRSTANDGAACSGTSKDVGLLMRGPSPYAEKFDGLAGRGMHELRFDELTDYLAHVAFLHGVLTDEFRSAAGWVVSELERKTNDERVIAVKCDQLRQQLESARAVVPDRQIGPVIRPTIDKASGLHELWLMRTRADGTFDMLAGPHPWPKGWVELYSRAADDAWRERAMLAAAPQPDGQGATTEREVASDTAESRCANCGKPASQATEFLADYPEEGEWFCGSECKEQHDELGCPHETHEGHRHPVEARRLIDCEGALRSLASWLGCGGFNAPTVDAKVFEAKIRHGVEHMRPLATPRAEQPEPAAQDVNAEPPTRELAIGIPPHVNMWRITFLPDDKAEAVLIGPAIQRAEAITKGATATKTPTADDTPGKYYDGDLPGGD